ncbi:MAG: tRNA preQ1(34) S-adenosylmethionine ribosyltransferase-isomerase QueA [Nitrospirae bacterium]|nr:MAG: tRNA preQ1(34) S-adenosylmethionine ribosyltransferase-isomerase QueA [Nitrospirota bacterium]
MKTADFDFCLPAGRIALRPADKRDRARLLVLHKSGKTEHKIFSDIVHYFNKGDILLLNNTKVFPARIICRKPSGGKLDLILVKQATAGVWEVLFKGRFSGKATLGDRFDLEIWSEKTDDGSGNKRFLKFLDIEPAKVVEMLWQYGEMPLPPYIKRSPDVHDKERYQTVYAENAGSIAAPTAGMHFTNELLDALRLKGVEIRTLTLHVGTGTFTPVKADSLSGHKMASEYFEMDGKLPDEIIKARQNNRRLISTGTTATRAIEGFMSGKFSAVGTANGKVRGHTDIFIYPDYSFKAVDGLITNFHLPKSTPLMLASAFIGLKNIQKSYEEALSGDYRFFSYGDAMLLLL